MTPHIGKLVEILREHELKALEITRLEEEKRQAIIQNRAERINEIVAEEQVLAEALAFTERKRAAHASIIAERLGLEPGATVEAIAAQSPAEDAEALRQARGTLSQAVQAMRKLLEHNAELIRYSLEHVRKFLASIAKAKGAPCNYRANGRREASGSSLFNQTA